MTTKAKKKYTRSSKMVPFIDYKSALNLIVINLRAAAAWAEMGSLHSCTEAISMATRTIKHAQKLSKTRGSR